MPDSSGGVGLVHVRGRGLLRRRALVPARTPPPAVVRPGWHELQVTGRVLHAVGPTVRVHARLDVTALAYCTVALYFVPVQALTLNVVVPRAGSSPSTTWRSKSAANAVPWLPFVVPGVDRGGRDERSVRGGVSERVERGRDEVRIGREIDHLVPRAAHGFVGTVHTTIGGFKGSLQQVVVSGPTVAVRRLLLGCGGRAFGEVVR